MIMILTQLETHAMHSLWSGTAQVHITPNESDFDLSGTSVQMNIDGVSFGQFSSHYTASEHVLTLMNEACGEEEFDIPHGLFEAVKRTKEDHNLKLHAAMLKNPSDTYRLQIIAASDSDDLGAIALQSAPKDQGFTLLDEPTLITENR